MKIEKGKRVRLEYELRQRNGELVESSEQRGPLEYVHGSGEIPIPELERQLEGLSVGDEKEGRVPIPVDNPPKEEYPIDTFPEGTPLDPGTYLEAKKPDGTQVWLRVLEKKDDKVIVEDIPFLFFKAKVLEITDA